MSKRLLKIHSRRYCGAAVLIATALVWSACATTSFEPFEPPARPVPAVHEVRRGDTLAWIADGYGVDVWQLAYANGIRDPDRIEVGQRLQIPDGARIVHYVRSGDTLEAIANRYRVPSASIARLNSLGGGSGSGRLVAGQRLVLPPEALLPPAPRPDPAVARASHLVDRAMEHYREARFEPARADAQEAEELLRGRAGTRALRARAAFVTGSALAGLGDDRRAIDAFARVRAIDPRFEPPSGWLSPRLEGLYREGASAPASD